ncbi:MAG: glycerophosphodiester phosphodiesterase [Blastocatellia bacterium]|nr:glycerophosphodiester phosphodiesterase [Blastocatellia bacterium]
MSSFPQIFAHRGARAVAPENTLAAFSKAFEIGADGIELDVMCSADRVLVVTHDYEVSRLSNGSGFIGRMTWPQIETLDFGSKFDQRFAGEKAPTLEQVTELLPPGVHLNIEIKNDQIRSHGEELLVARLIQSRQLFDRVLVSSFNPFVLRRLRKIDPRISIGWLYEARPPIYLRPKPVSTFLRPQALHPEFTVVTPELVNAAHRRGFLVNVWTVNEIQDMQRMIDCGVDAIITDYPDRALALKG